MSVHGNQEGDIIGEVLFLKLLCDYECLIIALFYEFLL